jgi:hypothetical protein
MLTPARAGRVPTCVYAGGGAVLAVAPDSGAVGSLAAFWVHGSGLLSPGAPGACVLGAQGRSRVERASESAVLCQLHPSCSPAMVDGDEGLGPEWVVYHELVATQRAYLRQVCAVEEAWVAPILPRLRDVDVKRLSGGKMVDEKLAVEELAGKSKLADAAPAAVVKSKADAGAVDAARQRFLERKRKAEATLR